MAGEELFRAARKGAGLLHGNLFFREEVPADYENAPAAVEEMSQRLAQKAKVDILVVAGYLLPASGLGSADRGSLSWKLELTHRLEDLTERPVISLTFKPVLRIFPPIHYFFLAKKGDNHLMADGALVET